VSAQLGNDKPPGKWSTIPKSQHFNISRRFTAAVFVSRITPL
jgi:hypothetical protein